jgi:hypothetical protein
VEFMSEDLEANRAGRLSSSQRDRLEKELASYNTLARCSPHHGALSGDAKQGVVEVADATVKFGPYKRFGHTLRGWAAELDEGGHLYLDPGVALPLGRRRVYFLRRSRRVVSGEPVSSEDWARHRSFVLAFQKLEPDEVQTLEGGGLPPRFQEREKRRSLWHFFAGFVLGGLAALATGCAVAGACSGQWTPGGAVITSLIYSIVLGIPAWFLGFRPWRHAWRDATADRVSSSVGPVVKRAQVSRYGASYCLSVDAVEIQIPDPDIFALVFEGFPARIYYTPTQPAFVALDPIDPTHGA